jgi:hypothetical protein
MPNRTTTRRTAGIARSALGYARYPVWTEPLPTDSGHRSMLRAILLVVVVLVLDLHRLLSVWDASFNPQEGANESGDEKEGNRQTRLSPIAGETDLTFQHHLPRSTRRRDRKGEPRLIGVTRSARVTRTTRFGRSLSLPP